MSFELISDMKTRLFKKYLPDSDLVDMGPLLDALKKEVDSLARSLTDAIQNIPKDVSKKIINDEVVYAVLRQNYLNIQASANQAFEAWVKGLKMDEMFAATQTFALEAAAKLKGIYHHDTRQELTDKKQVFELEFWEDFHARLDAAFPQITTKTAKPIDLHFLQPFVELQAKKFEDAFHVHYSTPKGADLYQGLLKNRLSQLGMTYFSLLFEATMSTHFRMADELAGRIADQFHLGKFFQHNHLANSEPRLNLRFRKALEERLVEAHKMFVDAKQMELCHTLDAMLADTAQTVNSTFREVKKKGTPASQYLNYKEIQDYVAAFRNVFRANFNNLQIPLGFPDSSSYFVYGDMETAYQAKVEKMVLETIKTQFPKDKDEVKAFELAVKNICERQSKKGAFEFDSLRFLPAKELSFWVLKLVMTRFSRSHFTEFEYTHFRWVRVSAKAMLEKLFQFDFGDANSKPGKETPLIVKQAQETLSLATFVLDTNSFHLMHNHLKQLKRTIADDVEARRTVEAKCSVEQLFELYVLFFGLDTLFGDSFTPKGAHETLQSYCSLKPLFFPKLIPELLGRHIGYTGAGIQHLFESAILGVLDESLAKRLGPKDVSHNKDNYHNFCVECEGKVKFDIQRLRNWSEDYLLNYGLVISGFLSEGSSNYLNWKKAVDQVDEMDFHGLNWEACTSNALHKTGARLIVDTIKETRQSNPTAGIGSYLANGLQNLFKVAENNDFHKAFANAKETAPLIAKYFIDKKLFDYRINSILSFSLGTVLCFDLVLILARAQNGAGPSPTGGYGVPIDKSHFCLDNLFLVGGCLDKEYFLAHVHELIAGPVPFVRNKIVVFHSRQDDTLGLIFPTAMAEKRALGYDGVTHEEIATALKKTTPKFKESNFADVVEFARQKVDLLDCSGFVRGHQDYKRLYDAFVYWKGLMFPREFKDIKLQ